MDIFEECQKINDLLTDGQETTARNSLIKLLDHHKQEDIPYDPLLNHLIRATGLYPYLDSETCDWQERLVYEAFKVDTGLPEPVTLHRQQSALLRRLIDGESIAVSAPTSFGKSFVIDAYISYHKPDNVMIIVPTIALTDETRRRIYKKFAATYKIITTTESPLAEKNIFIFPQERAINYLDKVKSIDLLVVDEFYKASANFDRDRSPALIKAILKLGQVAKQKYFLAPNISTLKDNPFTEGMEFVVLDFNTVFLEQYPLYEQLKDDDKLKSDKLLEILSARNSKTLIYAGTYSNIANLTSLFTSRVAKIRRKRLDTFATWLRENYHANWTLPELIERGTGVHNGSLHRSLSQIQVKLFEEKQGLNNIISTSSIIEGVNTSAENVVIWANRSGKGRARLNDFSYRNIKGRGGRMFRHFVGKIYILDQPPKEAETQLDIPFPTQILGDLDEKQFGKQLTREQVSAIILYKQEMSNLLGAETFDRLQKANSFQTSNMEILKKIAIDMKSDPSEWNGLGFLNGGDVNTWDRLLYKIIAFDYGWEVKYSSFVGFVKVLYNNWRNSIPELLKKLEPFDIGIDLFFKLERVVTFKLASIMNDVNILQKELLKQNTDLSIFVNRASHAFLPPGVYQLEEFGLPRMISKKLQVAGIIDFYNRDLSHDTAIALLKRTGLEEICQKLNVSEFEKYILDYFFDGVTVGFSRKD